MVLILTLTVLVLSNLQVAFPTAPLDPADLHVSTSSELAAGLENTSVSKIFLSSRAGGGSSSNFVLSPGDFEETIFISSGRNVTLASGGPGTLTVLDFNGTVGAILLEPGSSLMLRNLGLRGFASGDQVDAATWPFYQNFGFIAWPSLVVDPNATFNYINCTQYFRTEACSIRADVVRNGLIYGQQNVYAIDDRTIFFSHGTAQQPVYNLTTKDLVGTFTITFTSLTGVCIPTAAPEPAPGTIRLSKSGTPSSSNSGLIGGLVGGIGGMICLSVAAVAVFMCRKRNHGSRSGPSASPQSADPKVMAAVMGSPRCPGRTDPFQRGSSPRSEDLQGVFSQYLDTSGLPELWRLRKLGPLADEQVEMGPLLGQGGYGRVYKGRWRGALVAIKVVDHHPTPLDTPHATAVRAYQESILSTSLAHPNVVATYKICTTTKLDRPSGENFASHGHLSTGERSSTPSGGPSSSTCSSTGARPLVETLFIMEFCDRGSLLDAIVKGRFYGPAPEYRPEMLPIIRCLIDISTGMQYLHSVGVLHGDLKPGNVLLKSTTTDARGFICKLADFGVSRILDLEQQTHVVTQNYGTATFMPPEILKSGHLSTAADIYSFGMVMYQLLTRQMPFQGMAIGQVFWAVAVNDQRPDVPLSCPQAYRELMTSCWATEPAARPAFAEVWRTLQAMFKIFRDPSESPRAPASPAVPHVPISRPHVDGVDGQVIVPRPNSAVPEEANADAPKE
eukprot:jgi/Botrbrau1/3309/Bobra.0048s0006.1